MKKVLSILFMLPFYVFGQQFLWSTTALSAESGVNPEIIPVEEVTDKVLDYYNFYTCYYDLSGFSKDGFSDFLKSDADVSKSIRWNRSMNFDEPTAFAFKGNSGRGSLIVVMLMQHENIDLLLFSNEVGRGALFTNASDIKKFSKWFSSFWDYGNVQDDRLTIKNRGWAVPPNIEDNGQKSGVVMVDVRVARDGQITFAKVNLKGTTLIDKALWDKCERAVRVARFNEVQSAPREQRGVIPFRFRMK